MFPGFPARISDMRNRFSALSSTDTPRASELPRSCAVARHVQSCSQSPRLIQGARPLGTRMTSPAPGPLEFTKPRRRRRGQRRSQNEFIFYLRIPRYSKVIYFVYYCQNKFATNKAPGTDRLPTRIIKNSAPVIIPSI